MTDRTARILRLAAVGGTVMAFGGCLGGGNWWQRVATDAAVNIGYEFLLDNDAVFDLLQDDFGTGSEYDDRFTLNPSRDEPGDTNFPRD